MRAHWRNAALLTVLIAAECGGMWLIYHLLLKRLTLRLDKHLDELLPHLQAGALVQVTKRLRRD